MICKHIYQFSNSSLISILVVVFAPQAHLEHTRVLPRRHTIDVVLALMFDLLDESETREPVRAEHAWSFLLPIHDADIPWLNVQQKIFI